MTTSLQNKTSGAAAADAAVDPKLFRKVMGRFATGVTVITTEAGGEVRGMTANAFMSGSLEPPLCIVSVAKKARMHARLMEGTHFGVSILARGQEVMVLHFAGKPVDDLPVTYDWAGPVPLLSGSCATMATKIVARHDCGDHTLFIGHIFEMHDYERPPIVYHVGRSALLAYEHDHMPVIEFW